MFTMLLLTAGGSNARAERAPLQIFFAEAPALLVQVDGEPVYARVERTGLERITNTKALIVRDPAGIYYLRLHDCWMESYALGGEWSVSGVSPFGENTAAERAAVAPLRAQESEAGLASTPPTIFVVTTPAALVVTDGPPRYVTVPGTGLQYLANTRSKVYLEPTDQELYVGVGGRSYRAWTTDGPWDFVSASDLPRDIAIEMAR